MGNYKPPSNCRSSPELVTLKAGTVLYRVHEKKYDAHEFKSKESHQYYGGGRFDSTKDELYPFLYAGHSVEGAILETMFRDIYRNRTDGKDGPQTVLTRAKYKGRRVSAIKVLEDMQIVSLIGAKALAGVLQDSWLTDCEGLDYTYSRHWGHWIRSCAPNAHGFVWLSRIDHQRYSYVLFDDRHRSAIFEPCADPNLPQGDGSDFDTEDGVMYLKDVMKPYGLTVHRTSKKQK